MALPTTIEKREFSKFVEDIDGDVAVRVVAEDALPVSAGGSGGGNNTYSNAQEDFTATADSDAKTVTITGLPFILEAKHVVTGSIKQITSAGAVSTVPLTSVSVSSGVITLADMAANFASGDTVSVTLIGPDKQYDSSNDAGRVGRIDPEWSHYVSETHVLTDVDNGTPEYIYIDMTGYSGCSVHVEKTGGNDTFDIDFESSNEGVLSTDDWLDSTSNWNLIAGANLQSDCIACSPDEGRVKAHRIEVTTAGDADDADFNIFIYKW